MKNYLNLVIWDLGPLGLKFVSTNYYLFDCLTDWLTVWLKWLVERGSESELMMWCDVIWCDVTWCDMMWYDVTCTYIQVISSIVRDRMLLNIYHIVSIYSPQDRTSELTDILKKWRTYELTVARTNWWTYWRTYELSDEHTDWRTYWSFWPINLLNHLLDRNHNKCSQSFDIHRQRME